MTIKKNRLKKIKNDKSKKKKIKINMDNINNIGVGVYLQIYFFLSFYLFIKNLKKININYLIIIT